LQIVVDELVTDANRRAGENQTRWLIFGQSVAAELSSTEFHLDQNPPAQEQFQFQFRAFVRLVQNPVGARRAADVATALARAACSKSLSKSRR
jgi:hypothetical protein